MFTSLNNFFEVLLGPDQYHLELWHMVCRMIIVYIVGILILNIINKRFIGEKTPFDIILRFLIGSSLANAITGNSPYWQTLFMCLCLVLLNSLFSYLCLYSKTIDHILKGKSILLYGRGTFNIQAMHRYHFTQEDILSEVRKITGINSLEKVHQIFLENSGELSIMLKTAKAHPHNANDVDE